MPVFFQQQINEHTRLGVWKIEESEQFFKGNVPVHRTVTHPNKRLQHLAGRFLLQYLFPGFPYELIEIADTSKPYLPGERYHFSISHCGDYAAAIVSTSNRVGIDVEIPHPKVLKVVNKFLSEKEIQIFNIQQSIFNSQVGDSAYLSKSSSFLTLLWSAKEAVFKWYGDGNVDFRKRIQLQTLHEGTSTIDCLFTINNSNLEIHYHKFDHLTLTWIVQ